MSEQELKAHLAKIRPRMINSSDHELSSIRQDSLNAYMGEKYGNERDNRSSYVTMEVLEAIEWALPSLLRTFTAGDHIVSYDPVGPEDDAQSEQETDIVNHYLLNENNGFLTFYEWFKDALMYPNGYAKIYTETVQKAITERYTGLDEIQISLIDSDERREITEATENEDGTYDITVRFTDDSPVLRFEAVPPEQVLIDNNHNRLSLEDCQAVCHKVRRTKSWLLKAGYDPKKLELATSDDDQSEWNSERINRLDTEDEYPDHGEDDPANKEYWVEEWYVHFDYDGDGIAERRKVDYIGGEIFENIEYDYQPICALSCIPMTHRHSGMSLSDLMRPIQELSTYFRRGINDNIAQIIEPRKYVSEQALTDDGATLDQLLDPESNIVITRQPGLIEPEVHAPVIQEILAALGTLDNEKQVRSGIAPNLSLDPEVLQQSTMGGFTAALQEASQRIELIARVFAETGVRDAMLKAHRQIKEHQDKAKVMRIRGEWVETNPADWRERTNVTVNVGLGFNNKEKQVAVLMEILGIQREALQLGLATPENIYNTLEGLVESAGMRGVERYFTNPKNVPPKKPQPDPMFVLAQQDLQQKAQSSQAELQLKAMEHQFKERQAEAEAHIKARETAVKEREAAIKEMEAVAANRLKEAQAYKTTEEGKKADLDIDGQINGLRLQEAQIRAMSESPEPESGDDFNEGI